MASLLVPSPRRRKVAPLDLADWWARVKLLSPVRRDFRVLARVEVARRVVRDCHRTLGHTPCHERDRGDEVACQQTDIAIYVGHASEAREA